jgi:hypothetical protein
MELDFAALPRKPTHAQSRTEERNWQMERRLLERNRVSTTVYLAVPGEGLYRCRARNLSAMGVFLEMRSLGLPAGTVVNLIFAVNLGAIVRLHRRKAVVAHSSSEGAGLMMQSRARLSPPSKAWSPARSL